tara:strand:- start:189255 stop:189893 length:639 start_codon:yes stop_codon:yes gene_type:complete
VVKQGQNTKQRLLEAARGLFAERGYHNATVRDIALRAHTNLASINYYFRSKDDLYREVIRSTFQSLFDTSDKITADVAITGDNPQDRLRAFVRHLVGAGYNTAELEENRRLMAWEMLSPTGAIEAAEDWEIGQHLELALNVVRPLLAQNVPEEEARTAALWLIGQCLVFRKFAHRKDEQITLDDPSLLSDPQTNENHLIDLIVARAMGGLCV